MKSTHDVAGEMRAELRRMRRAKYSHPTRRYFLLKHKLTSLAPTHPLLLRTREHPHPVRVRGALGGPGSVMWVRNVNGEQAYCMWSVYGGAWFRISDLERAR